MAFGDADFATFFSDFAELALVGGLQVSVFVDDPSSMFSPAHMGSMDEKIFKITSPITAFTSLPSAGTPVVARGFSFTVATREKVGDGRVIEFGLKRA